MPARQQWTHTVDGRPDRSTATFNHLYFISQPVYMFFIYFTDYSVGNRTCHFFYLYVRKHFHVTVDINLIDIVLWLYETLTTLQTGLPLDSHTAVYLHLHLNVTSSEKTSNIGGII